MKLLEGKKALIFGIANKRSIAWGIAQTLHELTHLSVLTQEAIDFFHTRTRSLGDPLLAAGLQNLRVGTFPFGHRLDECDLAAQHLVVETRRDLAAG